MAEPERTTSFAKSVEGLHHEESALDRARALRDQFLHAQEQNNEKQKPREAERPPGESEKSGTAKGETEKSGSQMVREDAPVMRPTPSGPMRQPDRQAAYGKLAKERSAENRKIEAAKLAQEFKARQAKSHDHERDHER
jgi:hypothetical protein